MPANYDDDNGRITHEPGAQDGERLDAYLARVRPDLGDQAFWYAQCDANKVQVKDKFSLNQGMYTREWWFITWWDGKTSHHIDLLAGERPRMRNGFCHIVKEAPPTSKPLREPQGRTPQPKRPAPAPRRDYEDDPILDDLPF